MIERRHYVRLYLPLRLEYKVLRIKGLKKDTLIYNIGAGGICMYAPENFKDKEELSLDIFLPDGLGNLCAQAEVVWTKTIDDKPLVGLKFTNLSSFDRSRIISFVNLEKQKEEAFVLKNTNQIVFFKETELKDKTEIMNLLLSNINRIEQDLRFIDKNIDLPDTGRIDILCLDSYGALVIVEISTEENENILVMALKHYDWILRHIEILNKIYRVGINQNLKPRLILIAPHFSEAFKRLIGSVAPIINIMILEYNCIESHENRGLFLKKVAKLAKDGTFLKDFTPHDKEEPSTEKPELL
ncbi:MAG: endonuclease NucS [Candidatus Omnitrophica bacterium]|nr:endonuclease NucS [Candidatus Omnitrophota bacterium]